MLEVSQNPSSRALLIDPKDGPGPSRVWFRFFQDLYKFTRTAFAQIIKTTTTAAAASTPTVVTLDAISNDRRVTFTGSKVYIENDGLFNIQVSAQARISAGSADMVIVWLKINGTDLANSARHTEVRSSGTALINLNVLHEFAAGDYFEIYFWTTNARAQLTTIAAGAYPQSPAIILTVTQVL